MTTVGILGGGSFGTAIAFLLANNGHTVYWYMRNAEDAAAINRTHHNPRYLQGFALPASIVATPDWAVAIAKSDWLVSVIPCQATRRFLTDVKAQLTTPKPLVLASKGLEKNSGKRLSEVCVDVLGARYYNHLAVLSGPSFALEMMQQHPTAVMLAAHDQSLASRLQNDLFCEWFRPYVGDDVVGAEIGGALKNVIAIASGALTGLGYAHNTQAALITRSIAELNRFAVALGGDPHTLAGLAGMGDLILTCTGSLSRNKAIGDALARGCTLDDAIQKVGQVAEGIETTQSAYSLARQLGIETPIIDAVYRVLFANANVKDMVLEIGSRKPGREQF